MIKFGLFQQDKSNDIINGNNGNFNNVFVSITIGMTMRGKKVGRFRRRVFVKCNTNE